MQKLYIFCGIPFSGKTTLSKKIASQKDYDCIDLDDIKFQLYGKNICDAELKHKDWNQIYQETYSQIRKSLKNGKTVLYDTGNFTKSERDIVRAIAEKLGIDTLTVYVDTPVELAKKNLIENRKSKKRFDVLDDEFNDVVNEMEVPDNDEPHIVFSLNDDINEWINKYFE